MLPAETVPPTDGIPAFQLFRDILTASTGLFIGLLRQELFDLGRLATRQRAVLVVDHGHDAVVPGRRDPAMIHSIALVSRDRLKAALG